MKNQRKRTRSYYRHHRQRVIHRKKKLLKHLYWNVPDNQFGRLSKSKIHCSCGLCTEKTHNLGFPKSQKARIESLKEQLASYEH